MASRTHFPRRGSQGASRAPPGKSGLHARGEGERVAPDPAETRGAPPPPQDPSPLRGTLAPGEEVRPSCQASGRPLRGGLSWKLEVTMLPVRVLWAECPCVSVAICEHTGREVCKAEAINLSASSCGSWMLCVLGLCSVGPCEFVCCVWLFQSATPRVHLGNLIRVKIATLGRSPISIRSVAKPLASMQN